MDLLLFLNTKKEVGYFLDEFQIQGRKRQILTSL